MVAFKTMKMLNSIVLVLALVLVSGCGKSKETKTNPAVTQQTVPPPGGGGRPTGRTPGDGTKTPAPVNPPTLTPAPPQTPPINRPPVQPPQPTPQPKNPETSNGEYVRPKFDEAEAIKTGGEKLNSGKSTRLFYTGSAKDQAMETAYWLGTKKTDAERSVDMQIARDISAARLMNEKQTGKQLLSLTINEESAKVQHVHLESSDENTNILFPKKRERVEGVLEVLSAELRCLDANSDENTITKQNCRVILAKIQFANGQAQIIFRQNYAMIDAIFTITPQDYETKQNTGLELWLGYIANRVEHNITKTKIDSAIVSSYEIIGGRAEMGLLLTADDGASAGFRIPLVARAKGVDVNVDVNVHHHVDNRFDFGMFDTSKIKNFDLANAVYSSRLMKNNGRGDFQVELTFDKKEKAKEEQSKLVIIFQRNDKKIDLTRIN